MDTPRTSMHFAVRYIGTLQVPQEFRGSILILTVLAILAAGTALTANTRGIEGFRTARYYRWQYYAK